MSLAFWKKPARRGREDEAEGLDGELAGLSVAAAQIVAVEAEAEEPAPPPARRSAPDETAVDIDTQIEQITRALDRKKRQPAQQAAKAPAKPEKDYSELYASVDATLMAVVAQLHTPAPQPAPHPALASDPGAAPLAGAHAPSFAPAFPPAVPGAVQGAPAAAIPLHASPPSGGAPYAAAAQAQHVPPPPVAPVLQPAPAAYAAPAAPAAVSPIHGQPAPAPVAYAAPAPGTGEVAFVPASAAPATGAVPAAPAPPLPDAEGEAGYLEPWTAADDGDPLAYAGTESEDFSLWPDSDEPEPEVVGLDEVAPFDARPRRYWNDRAETADPRDVAEIAAGDPDGAGAGDVAGGDAAASAEADAITADAGAPEAAEASDEDEPAAAEPLAVDLSTHDLAPAVDDAEPALSDAADEAPADEQAFPTTAMAVADEAADEPAPVVDGVEIEDGLTEEAALCDDAGGVADGASELCDAPDFEEPDADTALTAGPEVLAEIAGPAEMASAVGRVSDDMGADAITDGSLTDDVPDAEPADAALQEDVAEDAGGPVRVEAETADVDVAEMQAGETIGPDLDLATDAADEVAEDFAGDSVAPSVESDGEFAAEAEAWFEDEEPQAALTREEADGWSAGAEVGAAAAEDIAGDSDETPSETVQADTGEAEDDEAQAALTREQDDDGWIGDAGDGAAAAWAADWADDDAGEAVAAEGPEIDLDAIRTMAAESALEIAADAPAASQLRRRVALPGLSALARLFRRSSRRVAVADEGAGAATEESTAGLPGAAHHAAPDAAADAANSAAIRAIADAEPDEAPAPRRRFALPSLPFRNAKAAEGEATASDAGGAAGAGLSRAALALAAAAMLPLPLILLASLGGAVTLLLVAAAIGLMSFALEELSRGAGLSGHLPAGRALPFAACVFTGVTILAALVTLDGAFGLGPVGYACAILAYGLWFGQVAAPFAHRMGMSRVPAQRYMAAAFFCLFFLPQHVSVLRLIHRRHAATPDDPLTADRDEHFWDFLARAWGQGFVSGFEMEFNAMRLRFGKRKARLHPYVWLVGGSVAVVILIPVFFGLGTLLAWMLLSALVQLQVFAERYVRHFGMERARLRRGRVAAYRPQHRRVGPEVLGGVAWLQDGRDPTRARGVNASPILPHPVPAMAAVALIPPVWKRLMDGRTARFAAALGVRP